MSGRRAYGGCWITLLALCAVSADRGWCQSPAEPTEEAASFELTPRNVPWFTVLDCMWMPGKPNLRGDGLRRLEIIYSGKLWGAPQGSTRHDLPQTLPSLNRVRAFARQSARTGRIVCLDVEHLKLRDVPAPVRERNLERLIRLADVMHDAEPGLRLGYYGLLPQRLNHPPHEVTAAQLAEWREHNARMAPLAERVDVVFPSLYTLHADPEDWLAYARANLAEARRYGKKVYPFLWPYFHPLAGDALGRQPVPGDYWRVQLEFCRAYADGVVLWSSSGDPAWDESAGWWLQTQAFLDALMEARRQRDAEGIEAGLIADDS